MIYICDQIWQKVLCSHTMLKHKFHKHLKATVQITDNAVSICNVSVYPSHVLSPLSVVFSCLSASVLACFMYWASYSIFLCGCAVNCKLHIWYFLDIIIVQLRLHYKHVNLFTKRIKNVLSIGLHKDTAIV